MGKDFIFEETLEVSASPEQVWEAIATGPGIDSWFMGKNSVEGSTTVRQAFGEYEPEMPVTAWDPPNRLRYGVPAGPDGRFVAFEFLVQGRDTGSTVLRVVNSGFLPGDDWAEEFEAMTLGGQLFWTTLTTYLNHFAGRFATPMTIFGPAVDDWPTAWDSLGKAMNLTGRPASGDRVKFDVDGVGSVEGEVYLANKAVVGIRTEDAFYRFMEGFHGPLIASHSCFGEVDADAAHQAWLTWMTTAVSKGQTS
ncbi:SRPBCC family protein [Labedaea rhizosphaerae]|uniref:Uncharacterized protein YndB with AHSA1/START domain n=1 Tax=Labedaea rhizosphaerae TaxID=598644 RepID=A0A4R6SBY8_LABRH|nr:SRPBCC domain-containing protein [Labedaea rhizosphaerae]TDP97482.1 uncharacterized protein YndB with AHSA1/START domain [Labedaea rhizosphaerae]